VPAYADCPQKQAIKWVSVGKETAGYRRDAVTTQAQFWLERQA